MSERLREWFTACVGLPILGYVAWAETVIWPCAFLFWGITVWFLIGKVRGWLHVGKP